MDTYHYILKKYHLRRRREFFLEIPNMGRGNLAELFSELGFTKGVEIGVEKGEYSEILCKANPNLHLFGVDPWKSTSYEKGTAEEIAGQTHYTTYYREAKKRLAPYNCTLIRKTSMDALAKFKDNSLDFVYIDGNHDFLHVTQDIHFWKQKIKPGGILSGHDYAYFPFHKFNHVRRVIDTYFRCYNMHPYFLVGALLSEKEWIRDKFRSWFWVKPI